MIGVRKWSTQFLPWLSFCPSVLLLTQSVLPTGIHPTSQTTTSEVEGLSKTCDRLRPRHSRPQPPVLEVPLLDRMVFGELFSTSLRSSPSFFFLTRIHCISTSACIAITAHRKENYLLAGSSVQVVVQAPSYITLYITRHLSNSERFVPTSSDNSYPSSTQFA
jgi:hypothetical protein